MLMKTIITQSKQDYNDPDPSGMKIHATPQEKEPWATEVLAKDIEWMVEEVWFFYYQLQPHDQV